VRYNYEQETFWARSEIFGIYGKEDESSREEVAGGKERTRGDDDVVSAISAKPFQIISIDTIDLDAIPLRCIITP